MDGGFHKKLGRAVLFKRSEVFTLLADKLRAKDYARRAGLKVAKLYGMSPAHNGLNLDTLPSRYVMKPNHHSSRYLLVDRDRILSGHQRDESAVNDTDISGICQDWLRDRLDFFRASGEYWYLDIVPQILVEEFLDIDAEFKWFCFNGTVAFVDVFRRYEDHRHSFYDTKWNQLRISRGHDSDEAIERPLLLCEYIRTVERASDAIRFVRVDTYLVGQDLYFGEFTFAPDACANSFIPIEFEMLLGEFLDRPICSDELKAFR